MTLNIEDINEVRIEDPIDSFKYTYGFKRISDEHFKSFYSSNDTDKILCPICGKWSEDDNDICPICGGNASIESETIVNEDFIINTLIDIYNKGFKDCNIFIDNVNINSIG